MAITDILKQLGMMLGDVGAHGGEALGNAMQAQGSPAAFEAQQAGQRQHAQLAQQQQEFQQQMAQQLQFHNSISPYEQAVLDQQRQAHRDVTNQQLFEDQMKMAQGISSGSLDQVFGPQQQFSFGSGGAGSDVLSGLLGSSGTIPGYTDKEGVINRGGISAVPAGASPKLSEITTVHPADPLGKRWGLTTPLTIPSADYAKYAEQDVLKKDIEAQKQATADKIEAARVQAHSEVDQRLSEDRFNKLYGSAEDPDMATDKASFHTQIDSAAATDKKQGNTTQMDQVLKQIREHKSDWETQQLAARKQKAESVDKRQDQSYQFNIAELNRTRKPVDDMAGRMGRLRDTINSQLPPADPLIPSELLTVMAGGMGSGLRINEAEINRAMTGQTHWQDLKAAIQKWALDPSKGLSVTPEYRQSLNNLLNIVQSKIQRKQDIFGEAENTLVNAPSPYAHRRAMQKMRHDVEGVDRMNLDSGGKPFDEIGSPYAGAQ